MARKTTAKGDHAHDFATKRSDHEPELPVCRVAIRQFGVL